MNKADKDRRLFGGWATVEVVDKQGEKVDIDAFKKVMKAFMDMGGNIIDTHSNKTVAKVLNYEFKKKEGEDALWLDMECYDHYDYHDEVWEKIKSGHYKGLSMGGRRKKGEFELKCDTDGCHNHVKGIELFEVSIVDKPANQEATIEEVNQMAKSDRPLTFSMICPQGNQEPCKDCHVAKMSVDDIMKPAAFDRCVEALEDDPDIESPHAVCTAAMKGNNGNPSSEEDTTKTGGTQMTEEEKKAEEAKGTPPAEETKETKQEPEEDPMAAMMERIAALEQVVARLTEEKQEEPEKPEEEEEEEEKGDATLKAVEEVKTLATDLKKQLEALKAPTPNADAERPDMAKTAPEPAGETKLDVMKMAEKMSHQEIAEKFV